MNAKAKLHNAKLLEWSRLFSEQKASGLCAKQWCDDNHISYHAFNYWKKQLKEAAVDAAFPDIVSLTLPDITLQTPATLPIDDTFSSHCMSPSIVDTVRLSVNGLDFQLESDVSDMFLAKLVKAVRYA